MEKEELLMPQMAGKILGVSIETLKNWEQEGKITSIKTAGGHRRYKPNEINQLIRKKETNVYKVIKNNCVIFYPKILHDLLPNEHKLNYIEVIFEANWDYLTNWGKGDLRPNHILCVSNNDVNYFKVFKYSNDIDFDIFTPFQIMWKEAYSLNTLIDILKYT